MIEGDGSAIEGNGHDEEPGQNETSEIAAHREIIEAMVRGIEELNLREEMEPSYGEAKTIISSIRVRV